TGHRRFTQQPYCPDLEERRKPASLLRPRNPHLPNSVLPAFHSGDLADQNGAVLHRVEVAPTPLGRSIVAWADRSAVRTRQPRFSARPDAYPHLLLRRPQLNSLHYPRSRQAEYRLVEGPIVHEDLVANEASIVPSGLFALSATIRPSSRPIPDEPLFFRGAARTSRISRSAVQNALKYRARSPRDANPYNASAN